MHNRSASSTVALFLLRFAALLAVTVAVLLSVSVRASRTPQLTATAPVEPAADNAQSVNGRRHLPPEADSARHR